MKHCRRCQKDKPFNEFNKDSSSKDMHFSWCRECSKKADKEKYARKKFGPSSEREQNHQKAERLMPERKICCFCNEEKEASFFGKAKSNLDGLRTECKTCTPKRYPHLYNKERYKHKSKEYNLRTYLKNRNKIIKRVKEWSAKNKDKVYLIQKKYKSKPKSRIKHNLSKRIKKVLAAKDISYDCSVGCTRKELVSYLEAKMLIGMTWENYGKLDGWHIDHIKPLESFDLTQKEERLAANNFKNLQPLWRSHNEKKSDNYDPDHPMGWHGLNDLLSDEDKKILGEKYNYTFGQK